MKVIISPAKRMRQDLDFLPPKTMPVFLERAQTLRDYLQSLSLSQLKALLCCNDAIAQLNFERYQAMDLRSSLTPAIFSYDGIQYQYMAPYLFTQEQFDYLEQHVRMLSGFYGLLRPFDGVTPYRLELQARFKTPFCSSLYEFWSDAVYQELTREDHTILNLTSAEYRRAVEPYLTAQDRFITCQFLEVEPGRRLEKGVYVKMARGEMVRFLAEQSAQEPETAKQFCRLGFSYQEELSDEGLYVFTRPRDWKKGAAYEKSVD